MTCNVEFYYYVGIGFIALVVGVAYGENTVGYIVGNVDSVGYLSVAQRCKFRVPNFLSRNSSSTIIVPKVSLINTPL